MPAPLAIDGINHVAIVTKRLQASRRFYRDVLGLKEVERPAFDFRGYWLYGYGLMIHIIENERFAGDPSPTIETRGYHLALSSRDLSAAEQLLQEHGIAYKKKTVPGGAIKQLFFQDPDGFHIEIGTHPPLPPWS